MSEKLKAFVLMPFESEFDNIYKDLIKTSLEDAGYEVARADSFINQQNILRDIIRGIATAYLIVADLTTLNPNVLYELGLCHGLRIPTILLTQSMNEIPFDLRPYNFQVYSTRFDQVNKLKQVLKEIGERHRNKEVTFGSPVTDFFPESNMSIGKISKKSAEESIEKSHEELKEEKGFLDFILEGNDALEKITRILSDITEETVVIGTKIKNHTDRIQTITKNTRPGTALQIHKIVINVASDMVYYSKQIEKCLPELSDNVDLLADSYTGYIGWVEPKTDVEKERILEFHQTVSELLEGSRVGLKGISSYRDAVTKLKGISMEINRASRRVTNSLEGIISTIEKIEAFCSRTLSLIDEKM
jgi:hypothetical protein